MIDKKCCALSIEYFGIAVIILFKIICGNEVDLLNACLFQTIIIDTLLSNFCRNNYIITG